MNINPEDDILNQIKQQIFKDFYNDIILFCNNDMKEDDEDASIRFSSSKEAIMFNKMGFYVHRVMDNFYFTENEARENENAPSITNKYIFKFNENKNTTELFKAEFEKNYKIKEKTKEEIKEEIKISISIRNKNNIQLFFNGYYANGSLFFRENFRENIIKDLSSNNAFVTSDGSELSVKIKELLSCIHKINDSTFNNKLIKNILNNESFKQEDLELYKLQYDMILDKDLLDLFKMNAKACLINKQYKNTP